MANPQGCLFLCMFSVREGHFAGYSSFLFPFKRIDVYLFLTFVIQILAFQCNTEVALLSRIVRLHDYFQFLFFVLKPDPIEIYQTFLICHSFVFFLLRKYSFIDF